MSFYKLYYFDALGVAEPIRLLFAYANVNYDDVRFARGPQWGLLKPKMPWNVVPVIEVDGRQISQSRAIVRFLGRKFGLSPVDDVEIAKCDEYIEAIVDLRTEGKKFHREQDAEKKSVARNQFVADHFIRYMTKFNEVLESEGTGYLVGSKVTYADIFVGYTVEQINKWVDNPNSLDDYPLVKTHLNMVMTLPGIKEWINTRPKTVS